MNAISDFSLNFFIGDGVSLLSLLIKHSESNLIWECLEKVLPKEGDREILKPRLQKILKKDESGLNLIDYSFLRRKNVVGQYVKGLMGILAEDGVADQEFPELIQIYAILTPKTPEELEREQETIEINAKKLKKLATSDEIKLNKNQLKTIDLTPYQSLDINDDNFLKEAENVLLRIREKYEESSEYFSLFNFKGHEYNYIDSDSFLQQAAEELKDQRVLGIDVEFTSLQGTKIKQENEAENDENQEDPKSGGVKYVAASIQISSLKKSYFIDTVKIQPIKVKEHLKEIFESEKILKIFHACDADINKLYRSFGIITKTIFDTARVFKLIAKEQNTVSLKKLAGFVMGIEIDKSFQVATWRVRPLPKGMLEYGLIDAFILLPIFYIFWKIVIDRVKPSTLGFSEGSELMEAVKWVKGSNFFFKAGEGIERYTELVMWAKSNFYGKWIKSVGYWIEYGSLVEGGQGL